MGSCGSAPSGHGDEKPKTSLLPEGIAPAVGADADDAKLGSPDASGISEVLPGTAASGRYEISGADMQVLSLILAPGEQILAERGSMMAMDTAIRPGVSCSPVSCCGRCISGESCCLATFQNTDELKAVIALTPSFPGKVVPIELIRDDGTPGRKFRLKNGTFFVGLTDAEVGFDLDCNPRTCCCAGQGCVRQTIEGTDLAFVWSMGTVLHKKLGEGESLVLESTALIAWEESVELDIVTTGGNLFSMGGITTGLCAGEGLFNTVVTGPGHVFFQSYTKAKMAKALSSYATTRAARGMIGGAPLDGGMG
mmetsp:Transcript_7027/g.17994  ORF Transcript_7027/g.17994 Transcript_7027/m.17994 type:complete len:309 (-) Transcript_7027:196-1122(-)